MLKYSDLIVWQYAVELARQTYLHSSAFPREEMYGLTSQLRRATVSIAANIAEGHARNSTAEFRYFLGIARGSLAEVETLVILANKLGFLSAEVRQTMLKQTEEINKMLNGLLKSLKAKTQS